MSCKTILGTDPLLLPSVQPAVNLEFHGATSDGGGDAAAQPGCTWPTFQRLRLKIRRCDDEMSVPASAALATNRLTPVGEVKEERVFIGPHSPPDDFLFIIPKKELKADSTMDTLGRQSRTIIDDGQPEPSCRASALELSSGECHVLDRASCYDGVKGEPSDQDESYTDEGELKPVLDEGELGAVLDKGEVKPVLDDGELKTVLKRKHKEVLDEGATAPPSHCGKIWSPPSQRTSRGIASQCRINSTNDSTNSQCSLDDSGTSQRQPVNGSAASSYRCDVCDESFKHREWLLQHRRVHTGARACSGGTGGRSPDQVILTKALKLTAPMMTHTGEKPFSCETCGNTFTSKRNSVQHMQVHTGEKPYKCETCGRAYAAKAHLSAHMRTHTGERPYMCEECGRTFFLKKTMVNHIKTHTGERPYKCETCGRAFAARCSLITHLRSHTGDRPYKCEICGRTYAAKGHLSAHMRTHTGERPYMCETCGRTFFLKITLVNHIKTHTGERPYKCETCGRAFAARCSLITHLRSHTGERPYVCEECGRTFTVKGSLTRHIGIHAEEKPYKCETCGRAFAARNTLTTHRKKHAG